MNRSAILKALEANLWDRTSYLANSREEGEVQQLSDLLLVDSGLPCATFNTIGESSLHPRVGMDQVEAAIKHFHSNSSLFSWVPWTALRAWLHGVGAEGIWSVLPGGGMDYSYGFGQGSLYPGEPPQRTRDQESFHISGLGGLYQRTGGGDQPPPPPPDENLKAYYLDTKEAAITHASPLHLSVGYVAEKPVAVQEAFSAHGILNFYAMAALSSTQGRGYGAALRGRLKRQICDGRRTNRRGR